MILVPLFDLKFLKSLLHVVQELQFGGTSHSPASRNGGRWRSSRARNCAVSRVM